MKAASEALLRLVDVPRVRSIHSASRHDGHAHELSAGREIRAPEGVAVGRAYAIEEAG
jgi:hypothetical protein